MRSIVKRHWFLIVGSASVLVALASLVNCADDSTSTPPASSDASASPTPTNTTPPEDASVSATTDASDAAAEVDADTGAPTYCDLGVARGDTNGGAVRLFDKQGQPLPSGRYRIRYVGGCMTYGGGQSFTIHAYEPKADAAAYATWVLVNGDAGLSGFQEVVLPGNWIFGADASVPDGGTYDSCVELNKSDAPVEFDYDAGAALGVVVNDSPLGDNVSGPDGGDPSWRLELYSPTGVCP